MEYKNAFPLFKETATAFERISPTAVALARLCISNNGITATIANIKDFRHVSGSTLLDAKNIIETVRDHDHPKPETLGDILQNAMNDDFLKAR